jgi:phosphonate C-P lyase system protein PhnG
MDDTFIKQVLQIIADKDIEILKEPETGLLMMTVKDSFDTDFYLGELLVPEAEVQYNCKRGYAMVIGDDCEKALVMASIEAILSGNDNKLKQQVTEIVLSQKEKIAIAQEKEEGLIARCHRAVKTGHSGAGQKRPVVGK